MLVWTDLETTGLDPFNDRVLEVAVIITDDLLKETVRFERVIYYPNAEKLAHLTAESTEEEFAAAAQEVPHIDPYVIKMHAKNGLWKACAESPYTRADVDVALSVFLKKHSEMFEVVVDKDTGEQRTRSVKAQLAGSTISFDRSFMSTDLPIALAQLHYRNVDVSTLNELGRRFWTETYNVRPRNGLAHRGMADIEESIAVCKHYLAGLTQVVQPGGASPLGDPK
jgi:oligoribonuclease